MGRPVLGGSNFGMERMKADYLTFRKAAGVSVQGMLMQAAFSAAMAIYAALTKDHTAWTITAFSTVGIVAWLSLWVVYDQHRRERIEAIEVEAASAASGGANSVFEAQEDFRPAAKRLAGLHKYFMPAMSIVIAILLLAIGLWHILSGRESVDPGQFSPSRMKGWGLGLGLVVAVLGFLVARYAAGMAKIEAWGNLRGGAAYAIGTAILSLVLAIGHFVHFIGPDAVSRYLIVIAPAFMILIGIEVFFNFVLSIYRPRKSGEIPRPAFDSRLLGFVSAPDRIAKSISDAINYQLGFDVTGGWFYQLLSKSLGGLVLVGVVLTWLLSSMAVVKPHQRGMILRFGTPTRADLGPGLHFKMPWPIESLYIPEYYSRDTRGRNVVTDRTVTGIRTIQLATQPPATTEPLLWTNDHLGEEIFQYVRSGTGSKSESGELADLAMVSVELPLQYVVTDIGAYDTLSPPERRDDLLRLVAQRETRRFFQTLSMDNVLADERVTISGELQGRVQNAFDALGESRDGKPRGAGVKVVWIGISGAHPPKDAAAAFEKPVEADQKSQALVEAARAEAIKRLTEVAGSVEKAQAIVSKIEERDRLSEKAGRDQKGVDAAEAEIAIMLANAGGTAAATLNDARADRWKRHMAARGAALRYNGQRALFDAAPDLYRVSHYYDALAAAMQNSRVYIASDNMADMRFDLNLEDKDLGVDVFRSQLEDKP